VVGAALLGRWRRGSETAGRRTGGCLDRCVRTLSGFMISEAMSLSAAE